MFSKKINLNFRSLFPRLILWSTIVLGLSLLIVSTIIYFVLSTSLKNKDRENLHHIALTIANTAKENQSLITKNFIRPELLFALYDANGKQTWMSLPTIIDNDSEDWEEIAQVNQYAQVPPLEEGWHSILLDASMDEDSNLWVKKIEQKTRLLLHEYGLQNLVPIVDNDIFEVLTFKLEDGGWLRIGTSFEPTDEYLSEIRENILYIILPFIFIGLIINIIVAISVLSPIKKLVKTIIRIQDGEKDVRALVKDKGDEIDILGLEFNKLLNHNDALIANLKETVDNIAHDLRTPLTHLNSSLEFAYLNFEDKDLTRSSLEDGLESVERILKLLNAILDTSESKSKTMALKLEDINLNQFFLEVSELYSYTLEDKKMSLEISVPNDLCVCADKIRLFQVIGNLLDNAIKFSSAHSKIQINAQSLGPSILIDVIDQGSGISKEDLPKIFDRLYRGDKSRGTEGVGLGLSIVKAIVKAHSGTINVKSVPNEGTIISLTLPTCNDSVSLS